MKIEWLTEVILNICYGENTDDYYNNTVHIGDVEEVDIIGDIAEQEVDIQFGNGDVAYRVSTRYFKIIRDK